MAMSTLNVPRTVEAAHIAKIKVVNSQKQIISSWRPQHQMWSLMYGGPLICAMDAVTGLYMNLQFRRKFTLPKPTVYTTYIMAAFTPVITHFLLRETMVKEKILLQNYSCPLCIEMRSVLLQVSFGVIYPIVFTGLMHLGIAANAGLRIPNMRSVGNLVQYYTSVTKPLKPALSLILLFHCILAASVTQLEMNSMDRIQKALIQFYKHKQLEQEKPFE